MLHSKIQTAGTGGEAPSVQGHELDDTKIRLEKKEKEVETLKDQNFAL